MKVFRIIRREFQDGAQGAGAKLFGGRWNPVGFEVIYTATSPYDAVREIQAMANGVPPPFSRYVLISLDLGKVSYRGLTSAEFSALSESEGLDTPQSIGRHWLTEQDTCVLIVPSESVQGANNVLINPLHPEFSQVTIGKFESLSDEGIVGASYPWYDYVDVKGVGGFAPAPAAKLDESRAAFDVFISHASQDKPGIATPLAQALRQKGLKPWLDEEQIGWGDSIERGVSEGLKGSRFVILILTKHFVSKQWTMAEYRSSFAVQMEKGDTRILPLVAAETEAERTQIFDALPLLKERKYLKWTGDPEAVAIELARRLP